MASNKQGTAVGQKRRLTLPEEQDKMRRINAVKISIPLLSANARRKLWLLALTLICAGSSLACSSGISFDKVKQVP